MLKQLTIFITLTTLVFTALPNQILAQDIAYEKANPDNLYGYNIKRLREKLSFVFAFSKEAKYKLYSKHLDRRLAELKYIVDHKNTAHIQKSSQRYSTTAGQLTEFVINNNLQDKKEKVISQLNSHKSIIEPLTNVFDSTTAEWRFVKYDLDYLNTYISQLTSSDN